MPEPGSEDEAVRNAREALRDTALGLRRVPMGGEALRVARDFGTAIHNFEAAIRAEERAKVEALVEAIIWMSGADDFAPGKPAHAHWSEIRDGVLARALAGQSEEATG